MAATHGRMSGDPGGSCTPTGARPHLLRIADLDCQPSSPSRPCTNRAPFIDSIAAHTGSRTAPNATRQAAQPIGIRRHRALFDTRDGFARP